MPTCKKCNTSFPNRLMINGKMKFLRNRKYCLVCSPYLSLNRKKLEISDNCTCKDCGKEFIYKRGHCSHVQCNVCRSNQDHRKTKQKAIDYKGGKCVVCKYDRCIDALCFHHRNPDEKEFPIAGSHCRSWERLQKELDKCELLCVRCHAEVHAGIIDCMV